MKPLFSVGEQCLVFSVTRGKLEETSVLEIVKCDIVTYPDGSEKTTKSGFAYRIDSSYKGREITLIALQEQLKKKHKPSDFDFDKLMSEIKDSVTV